MERGGINAEKSSLLLGLKKEELLLLGLLLVILGMVIVPVLPRPRTPAKESTTRAFLMSIETACAAYEFDFGAYPPDRVTINGKVLKSSESLVYHLTTAFRTKPKPGEVLSDKDGGPYLDVPPKHLKDTDGNGVNEIVDLNGEPFQYDNIRDDPTGFTFYGAKDPRQDKRPRNKDAFDLFTPNSANPGRPLTNFKCDWEGK